MMRSVFSDSTKPGTFHKIVCKLTYTAPRQKGWYLVVVIEGSRFYMPTGVLCCPVCITGAELGGDSSIAASLPSGEGFRVQ